MLCECQGAMQVLSPTTWWNQIASNFWKGEIVILNNFQSQFMWRQRLWPGSWQIMFYSVHKKLVQLPEGTTCPEIVHPDQGQRAATLQVGCKQGVDWKPFQRSWQNFNCVITRILAKRRSGRNCHLSLGILWRLIPWLRHLWWMKEDNSVSHRTFLLLTGGAGYRWGKLTPVHLEFIYN